MKTNQLSTQLQRFNMGTDQTFLTKLTKHIFSRYLDQYKDIEITFLRNKCGLILMRYYDGKGALRVTRVLRGDPISTRESGEWPEGAYIDRLSTLCIYL